MIRCLTALGKKHKVKVASSGQPERLGVDFAWLDETHDDWRGVQRKELNDFLASLDDGRLTKEVAQMNASILMPLLVLEGRVQIANGLVMTNGFGGRRGELTYASFMKRFLTLLDRNVQTFFTNEPAQTAEFIMAAYEWSRSGGHTTAGSRPKPSNDWGRLTNRDFQVHLLQGLDGVGSKTANAIVETLGRCPMRVDATVEELASVPGIGVVTARKIVHSINGDPEGSVASKGVKTQSGTRRGTRPGTKTTRNKT